MSTLGTYFAAQVFNASLKRLIHKGCDLCRSVGICIVGFVDRPKAISLVAICKIGCVFLWRQLSFVSGIGGDAPICVIRNSNRTMNVCAARTPKAGPCQFKQALAGFERQQLLYSSFAIRSLPNYDRTLM